jgi:hypothetical protein
MAARVSLAIGFVVATMLAFALLSGRRGTLAAFAMLAVLGGWWLGIRPTNDRDWQPDVSVTPWATREGDTVTIHGVRNFEYRTETDLVPRWETRTYDLRALDSADLIAVYWGSRAIAHLMVSFGFAGRDYVAVSIETRKDRTQSYSSLGGFFKQYELVYVVADERDVIGVRTSYRQPREDVYVYRLRSSREGVRRVFLDYLKAMNELRETPRFYNTLTTNCTTGILMHARVNPGAPPWSWKVLLTGYVPEYVHEQGRFDSELPFGEMKRGSRVNERAEAALRDPAFSRRIREGLPTVRTAR